MKRYRKSTKPTKTTFKKYAAKEAASFSFFVVDELLGLVNHSVDEAAGIRHKKSR